MSLIFFFYIMHTSSVRIEYLGIYFTDGLRPKAELIENQSQQWEPTYYEWKNGQAYVQNSLLFFMYVTSKLDTV